MSLNEGYIKQAFDVMSNEQQNWTELNGLQPAIDSHQQLAGDLNTPSNVADHRLMKWLFAAATADLRGEVDEMFENQRVGQLPWYKKVALDFQLGDPLVFESGQYGYNPVIPANQIIKYASPSVRQYGFAKVLVLKVAGDDGNGNPIQLPSPHYTAFNEYFDLQAPMVPFLIISADADIFKYGANVVCDPLIIYVNVNDASDPLNGSLLSDPTVFPVHNTIKNYAKYLTSGSYIDFDGKLQLNRLEAEILGITGIIGLGTTVAAVKVGANPYSNMFLMPNLEYRPYAGYATLSEVPGETLIDLLNFTVEP